MPKQLEATSPRPTLSHRAEVLASLIDAILSWGNGDESNETREQPFAHQTQTAPDANTLTRDASSAADAMTHSLEQVNASKQAEDKSEWIKNKTATRQT